MEDTQKDGDDLLSIIVKEEFIVQEEDVQYVEVENSCRGGLVTGISDVSDSHSTTTPYSSVKKEEIDEVNESQDLKRPPATNFKCEQCGKVFCKQYPLKRHLESHSAKFVLCEICNKACNGPISLKKHMKTHAVGKKIECYECGVKFTHRDGFRRHFRRFHLGIRNFKCEECGKVFYQHGNLRKHQESQSHKLYSCEIGENKYRGSLNLTKYLKTHAVGEKIECDECVVTFAHQRSFRRHFREAHLGITTNFTCKECGKVFRRDSHLRIHQSYCTKVLSCEVSKKTRKGSMALKKYNKTQIVQKFECDKCGTKITHERSFIRHYRKFHLVFNRHFDFKIQQKIHLNKSLSVTIPEEHQKDQMEESPDLKRPPATNFKCEECGKVLCKQYSLKRHLESHSKKFVVCEICNKACNGPISLKKHMETHAVGKKIECDECGVKFTHRDGFRRHFKKFHLDIRNFKCEQCGKVFYQHVDFEKHKESHSQKLFSRKISKNTNTGSLNLTKYLKTHAVGEKIECDECGVKFAYQSSFRRHFREFHLSIRKFECGQCEEVFRRDSHLRRHQQSHCNKIHKKTRKGSMALKKHNKTEGVRKFECDKCEKTLLHERSFIRHYREFHLRSWIFKCKKCEKMFKRKFDLQTHLKSHLNKFECHECGITYRNVQCLQGHLASIHGSLVTSPEEHQKDQPRSKNFKCKQCGKVFSEHFPFKRHLESHSIKFLPCEVCNKECRGPISLKYHMKTHVGKKIECDECGRKFSHVNSFRRHFREFHLRIENFKCEKCEKIFYRHCDFKKHMEKECNKVHSCEICEKVFRGPMLLKRHIKTHVAVDVVKKFECEICGVILKSTLSLKNHCKEVHVGSSEIIN